MTEYPERQMSGAAGWSRSTAAFSAVLLLVDWAGHHFGLVEDVAFLWVLAIVALLAALAFVFAAFGFSRIWNFGDFGGRDLTIGILIGLLVLAPYGVAAWCVVAYPPLRDISTDMDTPPSLPTASARTAGMNAPTPLTPGEKRLQAENYPDVTARRYDLPLDETVAAVEAVLGRQGWQIPEPLPPSDGVGHEITIGAVARSFVLELPADVAIRVATDGDASLVDMRSASRFGRHDLGDNAARVASFLNELDKQVAGLIGTAAVQ